MIRVPLVGQTIPHEVHSRHSAAIVMLRPAAPGTGVIAGRGARAVLEAAGVRDILTKSHGSNNVLNVTLATMKALEGLKDPRDESRRRDLPLERVMPFWGRAHV
jgi:small subunit ribosomal protein S5